MNSNEIELKIVTLEKKHILENIISLYLHDLSEFACDLKINKDGQFEYDGMKLYFSEEELKPFFICLHDEIIGFVLLNSGKFVPEGIDYIVNELFILNAFRKKGIAKAAVRKLLHAYNGIYEIEQLSQNKVAVKFWNNFYRSEGIEYVEKMQMIDGYECCVQKFSV